MKNFIVFFILSLVAALLSGCNNFENSITPSLSEGLKTRLDTGHISASTVDRQFSLSGFEILAFERLGTKTEPEIIGRFQVTQTLKLDYYKTRKRDGTISLVSLAVPAGSIRTVTGRFTGTIRRQTSDGIEWDFTYALDNDIENWQGSPLGEYVNPIILGTKEHEKYLNLQKKRQADYFGGRWQVTLNPNLLNWLECMKRHNAKYAQPPKWELFIPGEKSISYAHLSVSDDRVGLNIWQQYNYKYDFRDSLQDSSLKLQERLKGNNDSKPSWTISCPDYQDLKLYVLPNKFELTHSSGTPKIDINNEMDGTLGFSAYLDRRKK